MLFEIDKLRNMTREELNDKYRGTIPHAAKDDDSFFKMLEILYQKLGITPTIEQHNIILASSARKAPILVDSCPGSGKTTLAQMLTLVDELMFRTPSIRILNITYSSQAAADMKARHTSFCAKFGIESKISMRTMHSFYSSYIETYAQRLGMASYSPKDNLLRDEQVYLMLRKIYLDIYNVPTVQNDTIKDFYGVICYIKDSCIEEDDIQHLRKFKDLKTDIHKFIRLTRNFEAQKKLSMPRLIDFNDMQVLFLQLITENQDILDRVKNSYDRIIVDEYQDSSTLQLKILEKITKNPNVLLAIGDRDQQIYGWRGASPYSYQEFQKKFEGTELHTMGINMRCPNNIIETATKLIRYNPNRNEKHMKGTEKIGTIDVIPCKHSMDVTRVIAERIEEDFKKGGAALLRKHVVLYRTHTQPMFLIDTLLKRDIPLNAIGTKLPYDDKIVKDFIDIYYMLENPRDGELAGAHLFKICRSFNKRQMANVKKNLNGFNTILDLGSMARKATWEQDKAAIEKTMALIEKNATVGEIARAILPSYYNSYYKAVAEFTGVLEDHVSSVMNYLTMQNLPFQKFMASMMKIQKKLREYNKVASGITLGTVHSSKGLEYEKVYIFDPNSMVAPNEKTVDGLENSEKTEYLIEELNLFYVAMTRAKIHLVIPFSKGNPSRFMYYADLLPEEIKKDFENINRDRTNPIPILAKDKQSLVNKHPMEDLLAKTIEEKIKDEEKLYEERMTAHIDYLNSCAPTMMDTKKTIKNNNPVQIPDIIVEKYEKSEKSPSEISNKSILNVDLNWTVDLDKELSLPNM